VRRLYDSATVIAQKADRQRRRDRLRL